MLNFAGHNIADEICEVLSSFGYACSYTLLNAAMYGVPQTRERALSGRNSPGSNGHGQIAEADAQDRPAARL